MKKRPVFLNLFFIKFPFIAIVSILHRIVGVFLFLFIPSFLYFLYCSLLSEDSFFYIKNFLYNYRFLILIFLSCFFYHFLVGFRHILMDLGFGESKNIAFKTACFVMSLSILSFLLGLLLCYL